ncbi:hypothetical protein BsWGS_06659 [Bradybaena similaris]
MGKNKSKKQKVESPAKGKKAVPVQPVQQVSDEESSSEEEVQVPVKPQKLAAIKAKPVKKAESSSEEEEESSEEEAPPAKPAVNSLKKIAVKAPAKEESSSEEDSDEDDDDDDEEEEAAKPAQNNAAVKKAAAPVKTPVKKNLSDEDDDSEEDDSEEEVQQPVKPAKLTAKKPAKESDDDDDDEDDDDDDSNDEDESEEEETKSNKRKRDNKEGPAAKKKKGADGEAAEAVTENRKRKKEKGKEEATPKKQQKLEAVNGDETITLFVGNLSKNTTEEDVSNFFTEASVSVAAVRKPPNKNNAFVDLEDASELETALALNGSELKKNTITVDKAKPRVQKEQNNQSFGSPGDRFNKGGDDDKDSRTLFVKNLPEDATIDSLSAIFDTASDVRIPMRDGAHKGFGFVEFADKESLEAAMSEKQGAELNGSSIYLDYMGAKSSFKKQRGGQGGRGNDRRGGRGGFGDGRQSNSGMRGESKVLFVKNLSYDTDESSLKAAFDGAVSARIPTFPDSGKPKGFAFVDFGSADAAADAFDSMNGQSIDGRQVTLDFAADKGSGGGGGFGRGGGGFGRGRGGGGGFGGGRGRGGGGFGGRGGGGRGRGGPRGGGGRGGGFNKARGGLVQSEGKKTTFDDSD